MTWSKRFAVAGAAAMLLTLMGMLAAEATCTSNNTNPPDGYMTTTVCALEGSNHGDPYTGRDTRPLMLDIYEYNNNGSYSSTDVQVRQNRFAYEPGGQAWRESVVTIGREQYIQPLDQYLAAEADLYQYHFEQTDQPDQQYTYGVVNVRTMGAVGSAQVYAHWQQYPSGEGCLEQGHIYAQANSSTSSTPIDEHDCVVQAPTFPDMP